VRIGTVLCFVLGAVAMGSSGVGVLIPETGRPGLDWIADVEAAGGLFFTGAWLVILMGFLGIVAAMAVYGFSTLACVFSTRVLALFSALLVHEVRLVSSAVMTASRRRRCSAWQVRGARGVRARRRGWAAIERPPPRKTENRLMEAPAY
jgi:hypothetical protein